MKSQTKHRGTTTTLKPKRINRRVLWMQRYEQLKRDDEELKRRLREFGVELPEMLL